MLHKKLLLGVAVGVPLSGAALAQAKITACRPMPARSSCARGLVVVPEDNASSIDVVGGHVDATTTAVPEVDLSDFLTKNIAIEAIAAVTPHTIKASSTAAGNLTVGDVWLLPPTVTLQYHFGNGGTIDPYLGAGLNYTWFFGESHRAPFTSVSYDDNVGGALQAGVDVSLGGGWVANFDVKQLILSTTAHSYVGAAPINAKVDLDPLLAGVGIGYRWGGTPTPAARWPGYLARPAASGTGRSQAVLPGVLRLQQVRRHGGGSQGDPIGRRHGQGRRLRPYRRDRPHRYGRQRRL